MGTITETEETKAKAAPAPKYPTPARDEPTGTAPQKGAMRTAKLYVDGESYRNPTSKGGVSLELVKANPGITGEELEAAGGRIADIQWDLKHHNSSVKIRYELAPEPEKAPAEEQPAAE